MLFGSVKVVVLSIVNYFIEFMYQVSMRDHKGSEMFLVTNPLHITVFLM